MPLTNGSRIGQYEVLEFCAAGGMGEVYRARDTRLNRDVALKVLPEGYLHDPERLARFRREAQLLASLNHPNIAAIHGVEEAPGIHALVMEFVEGPTLHELIAGSSAGAVAGGTPGLTLDEAIGIARQLADALEAAHEHGIVHRDLKPANIKVRPDGTVKVLDFGLARALDTGSGSGALMPAPGIENSPTITSPVQLPGHGATAPGVILGTAAYMSPEQARGKAVDKRADIWAFGVVLYEMVAGRRLFRGDHVTDVLAAVVRDTPDLSAAPPALRRVIEKCLEKDPRKRLRDISSVSLLLDDTTPSAPHVTPPPAATPWISRRIIAASALLVASVGALAAFYWPSRSTGSDPESIEFSVYAPQGQTLMNTPWGAAVSPDGQQMVFSTYPPVDNPSARNTDPVPRLWLRSLGSSQVRLLEGTEGATGPIWSPDGKSIAFLVGRRLLRVDPAGGSPIQIADLASVDPYDSGSWNAEGTIVLACPCGIERVTVASGERQVLIPAKKEEEVFRSPQFLPDGDRFIFFVQHKDRKVRGVYASSLSRPGERTLILNTSARASFVSAGQGGHGYLLSMDGETLLARAFDASSLAITGDPVKVADRLQLGPPPEERPAFWTSGKVLVFAPRVLPAYAKRPLVWMDREGAHRGEVVPEGPYNAIALSPDGGRVALTRWAIPRSPEANGDIWLWDFARETMTRFTFDPATDENPVWSPDGQQIAYSSQRAGPYYQVYRKNASGTGDDERLTNVAAHTDPLTWSPDGRFIVYRQMNRGTGWDLMALPLEGDRKPIVLLQSPHSDSDARFSPDGKWLAYHSRLNERSIDVYIQAFNGAAGLVGDRMQVSNASGIAPLWRRDGRELIYATMSGRIMSAEIDLGPPVRVGRPRELFVSSALTEAIHFHDVTADGKRLITVLKPRSVEPAHLTLVTNWQQRLGGR
jgi:serine/threonine protein kinase